MRILHVIPSIDPRLGGVAATIRVRGARLLEMGHEVEVASLDAPDSPVLSGYPLVVHPLGPGKTHWYYSRMLAPWLRANSNRFDAVVVDGIWQYHGVAVRRAVARSGIPFFVIPHGMLGSWFKQTYPLKHAKKWIAWLLFDYWVLRDASGVLFSCDEERKHASRSFWLYRAKERTISNGASPPPESTQESADILLRAHPELRQKRVILFLGRIQPIKGLDLLIEAFARVSNDAPTLHLAIAGPGDKAYTRQLQVLCGKLSVAHKVSWLGMLDPPMKWAALRASEVLALPSHHENFGVVVAEALACSVPVLISDQVNIWETVESAKAGFVAPDTLDGTTLNLRRWLELTAAQKTQMRYAALQAFENHFHVDHMANSLVNAIQSMRCDPAMKGETN